MHEPRRAPRREPRPEPPRRGGGRTLLLLALVGVLGAGLWWLLAPRGEEPAVAGLAAQARSDALVTDLPASGAFHLDLTPSDLADLLVTGTATTPVPLEQVDVTLTPAPQGALLGVAATRAGSRVGLNAEVALFAASGQLDVDVRRIDVAGFALPAAVDDAIAGVLGDSAVLAERLASEGVVIDRVVTDGATLTISGETADAEAGTAALRDLFAGPAHRPAPEERLGPGRVDGLTAAGPAPLVAIGDSIAAGTGLAEHRASATARLHAALERADGTTRGYRNLARPGARAADVAEQGQLDDAVAALAADPGGVVVVSVGANDLLHLLEHGPCARDLTSARCDRALAGARRDLTDGLDEILAGLRQAEAGRIVVLSPYNPFSVGSGSEVEGRTDAALAQFAAGARDVSDRYGAVFVDPAADFAGRAASLTLIGAQPPDIHPTARGHDVLAAAMLDALR